MWLPCARVLYYEPAVSINYNAIARVSIKFQLVSPRAISWYSIGWRVLKNWTYSRHTIFAWLRCSLYSFRYCSSSHVMARDRFLHQYILNRMLFIYIFFCWTFTWNDWMLYLYEKITLPIYQDESDRPRKNEKTQGEKENGSEVANPAIKDIAMKNNGRKINRSQHYSPANSNVSCSFGIDSNLVYRKIEP